MYSHSAQALLRTALSFTAWVLFLVTSPVALGETSVDPVFRVLEAERDESTVNLRWELAEPQRVSVYMADEPGADQRSLIASGVKGNSLPVEVNPGSRPYFHVKTAGGSGRWVAERVLPLDGGRNFRDLGGYRSQDGRYTRWGVLYRSGTMAGLTTADYQYLGQLGINTICDFRSIEERKAEPTLWQRLGADLEYLRWDYSRDSDEGWGSADWLSEGASLTAAKARHYMTEGYREAPFAFGDKYREMFAQLVAGQAPLTFNCSAGKDRTGVAAALLLTALGVDRQTIYTDYAMSEKVVDYRKEYSSSRDDQEGSYSEILSQIPPEAIAELMRSRPEYLQTAFEAIEAKHGSVRAYMAEVLHLDDLDLAKLQTLYLEP
ncbi:tyrosine-protein phosphatase [Gilvimarinus sp. F26214L]|uniref:tyrosine-protein phosphatase n=1 Tax=Gilvimarinus sp. DZF01 TaxID=3461371 RepID=UPI004045D41D